jgi:hypothetical protein
MPLTPTPRGAFVMIDPNPTTGDFIDPAAQANANMTKVDGFYPYRARKTAEPTNLTVTLLPDPELRFTIPSTALGRYSLTGYIQYKSSATAGFRMGFTHSGAFGMRWTFSAPANGQAVTTQDSSVNFDTALKTFLGTGGFLGGHLFGTVNFTGAGTFILNFSQNPADAAGDTKILTESWMRLDPIP